MSPQPLPMKDGSSASRTRPPPPRPPWRNPWVVLCFLIVSVVLSVNGGMLYLAIDSSPGLVVEDYYERGQNYEETVLTRQALSRNLLPRIDISPRIEKGKPATFRFVGLDRTGRPIRADAITLHAYRPSDTAYDFSIPMTEMDANRYLAEATFPLKGVWDIVIAVKQGEIEHNVPRRITVTEMQ
uniref:Nitrogen fixation protein FixH n=1 Tax=Candidatus Kentrum sp. TC TaxID=2126339 RepID=A0A450ZTE8_9GAMM|nr:MAG: Nitrogen fixation protein FixH [Candidatus Kentron sp. TC]VFK57064.1 MAG: Nitrogen fixation protein FixH [Candidatus Kentron sp. TC]